MHHGKRTPCILLKKTDASFLLALAIKAGDYDCSPDLHKGPTGRALLPITPSPLEDWDFFHANFCGLGCVCSFKTRAQSRRHSFLIMPGLNFCKRWLFESSNDWQKDCMVLHKDEVRSSTEGLPGWTSTAGGLRRQAPGFPY
jgi:hypothetical protein